MQRQVRIGLRKLRDNQRLRRANTGWATLKPYAECSVMVHVTKPTTCRPKIDGTIANPKWTSGKQPPDAYPKFVYTLVYRDKHDKRVTMPITAYTDALAKEQALSLTKLFDAKLIKLSEGKRLCWSQYNVPWKSRTD